MNLINSMPLPIQDAIIISLLLTVSLVILPNIIIKIISYGSFESPKHKCTLCNDSGIIDKKLYSVRNGWLKKKRVKIPCSCKVDKDWQEKRADLTCKTLPEQLRNDNLTSSTGIK